MTEYNCWVTFEDDKELQSKVKDGWFISGKSLPLSDFPVTTKGNWMSLLTDWCEERGIELNGSVLSVSAKVRKKQILDFIDFAYSDDPSFSDPKRMLTWKGEAYLANRLTNLRSFVAQQLRQNVWYELHADEF